MFRPSDESVSSVLEWLVMAGVSRDRIVESNNRGWLTFNATGEESEELVMMEYYEYQDSGTGQTGIACDDYILSLGRP